MESSLRPSSSKLHPCSTFLSMPSEKPVYLTEQEAADFLSYAPKTLREWRHLKKGPRYIRVDGFTIRYREADLIAWMESREQVAEG